LTFDQALAYLHSLQRFGMKPGLDRTVELLRRAGRPDLRAGRIIHITGTSGKGSVAAMVEAALRAAGLRTGLYTSPSLERYTERMQVDRREISEAEFAGMIGRVQPLVQAMVAEGREQPTEFEVLTVAAFLFFAEQQVDWLVLEVGLGGRFDATTAVQNPVMTCITNIGLDHTDWLGNTHEEIAWDKAGILKPAVPCVTGTEHPGALAVIRQVAVAADVVLTEVSAGDYVVTRHDGKVQTVDLRGGRGWYRNVALSLLGRHQAGNAAVALRLLELAGVTEPFIREGLAAVEWPGRFEILTLPLGGPTLLLDAAHNPAKCEALAAAVREYFPGRPVTLILGVLADKNVPDMARPLLQLAARVYATTPVSPRALPAERLGEVCEQAGGQAPEVQPTIANAVESAIAGSGPDDLIIITGSFYVVGPARRHLHARLGRE